MATQEERQRKLGIFILVGVLALAALAFAAANSGIPWLEAWFNGGQPVAMSTGGNANADADGDLPSTGGESSGGASGTDGNGCFLGFICLNASVNAGDVNANARADDEGINIDSD